MILNNCYASKMFETVSIGKNKWRTRMKKILTLENKRKKHRPQKLSTTLFATKNSRLKCMFDPLSFKMLRFWPPI